MTPVFRTVGLGHIPQAVESFLGTNGAEGINLLCAAGDDVRCMF